jgi:hypothetical protein
VQPPSCTVCPRHASYNAEQRMDGGHGRCLYVSAAVCQHAPRSRSELPCRLRERGVAVRGCRVKHERASVDMGVERELAHVPVLAACIFCAWEHKLNAVHLVGDQTAAFAVSTSRVCRT